MAKQTKVNTTHYLYVEMRILTHRAKYRLANWTLTRDIWGAPCYLANYSYFDSCKQRYHRKDIGNGLFPVKDIISKRIRKIKK